MQEAKKFQGNLQFLHAANLTLMTENLKFSKIDLVLILA